jgi:hypothetical protein
LWSLSDFEEKRMWKRGIMKQEEEPGSTSRFFIGAAGKRGRERQGSLYTLALGSTSAYTVSFARHNSMTQVTASFEDATAR